MKVSPLQPFELVFSLYKHEYLGFLIESFVVQINSRGEYTLQFQNVSSKNINEFAARLDSLDYELVKLMDAITQDAVLKKFNTKKQSAIDFFLKVYDKEKGDKSITDAIQGYIEKYRAIILDKLRHKPFFIMGNDGEPTWRKIDFAEHPTLVHFHFDRNDTETVYYPIIKCNGDKLNFQFKDAEIINDEPAYLLMGKQLYFFEANVDGKKIRPFLSRPNIIIPRKIEDTYFHKFLAPLISQFRVYAKGFTIRNEEYSCTPVLLINELQKSLQPTSLFDESLEEKGSSESDLLFDLSFQYGHYTFRFDSLAAKAYVNIEKIESDWLFHKVIRDLDFEKSILTFFQSIGLDLRTGRSKLSKPLAFSWLNQHFASLTEKGIEIRQKEGIDKVYFIGYSSFDIRIEETNDWFDIKAKVQFGEFEIPFVQLRKYILAKKREFTLPNGQVAVIPEEWFARYSELLGFAIEQEDESFVLKKHHLVLVQDLSNEGLAHTVLNRKLEKLQDFDSIEEQELPETFVGELRPYQKAAYDWLHFLRKYKFGGCLADDMGLGKTVTTLAFLESLRANSTDPTLLVMPTSLIYNWQKEAERFTPNMRIYIHAGTFRAKNATFFKGFDLILMSYGILRLDIDFIKSFRFNYVVLDESQAIKNPSSAISQTVMELNSANRLILTGTPLENSTMDLWTQLTFINPGLLGSQAYFKNNFQQPIEKQQDETAVRKLYAKIKPFMLRRHKSQVAKELPEKVETLQYSDMTPEQEKMYEETKSYYRNLILDHIEEKGISKSQFIVLQGLTKLRQLANHPLMVDDQYEGNSGKAKDVLHKLESVLEEKSKVLIFSQFVKHLTIFRTYLDERNISYCYLDGSTTDRQTVVTRFQTDEQVGVFLISLKAGGVGLNLTAAEYVFLLDPWWNPAIEAQAVDRAHRIGQMNTVFTYKFITRNSVEEKIVALQRSKKKLFDDLITTEETFVKSLSKDDVVSLLT